MEKLVFSVDLQEQEVTLNGADGSSLECVIRELTGEERDSYLDGMAKRFKFGAKGEVQGVGNFKGLHMDLLRLCLIDTATKKPVTNEFLKAMPSSTMSALFKVAQELSALDQVSEEEAKND